MTKRRSSWRRWVVRGAVCVVLGLLTTVGVAWGLVALNSSWGASYAMGLVGPHDDWTLELTWHGTTVGAPGLVRRAAERYIVGGWADIQRVAWGNVRRADYLSKLPHAREEWGSLLAVPPRPNWERESRLEQAAGWPWLALWTPLPTTMAPRSLTTPMAQAPTGLFEDRVFPMRPVWKGLLLDVGLYTTLWGSVLFVPSIVRSGARRRRGWCAACGYDLVHKFDAGCPECGWNRV